MFLTSMGMKMRGYNFLGPKGMYDEAVPLN
jgi:hypothetical protein